MLVPSEKSVIVRYDLQLPVQMQLKNDLVLRELEEKI